MLYIVVCNLNITVNVIKRMLYNICYITSNWSQYKKKGCCYVALSWLYNKKLCYSEHPNLPYVPDPEGGRDGRPAWHVAFQGPCQCYWVAAVARAARPEVLAPSHGRRPDRISWNAAARPVLPLLDSDNATHFPRALSEELGNASQQCTEQHDRLFCS